MVSVDTRSHTYKQLVDISTFRIYANSIQTIRKTLLETDIGKHSVNIPVVFLILKKFYIIQKSKEMYTFRNKNIRQILSKFLKKFGV
ncbi:hypothetical protein ASJ81_07525 [Methanosarcina spelaei]|uniref:Uncharacterized protein n=1 Tax=Methanosarcina spelaei TaxID=1036679 RepID=A0A2A2HS30_9EURY|nr:hypothetical protein ASJ81_07525 [Methanosarcina spelaei]